MAVLTVTGSHDYRSDSLSGITEIKWTGNGKATFSPDQFDDTQIATNVLLQSLPGFNPAIEVTWTGATGFSAANWTFGTFWDDLDEIIFRGGSAGDLVIGSTRRDQFYVSGADTFFGGDSSDTFIWNSANDLAPNTHIDGGSGGNDFDNIRGSGVLDFASKATTFVEIEYVFPLAGSTMIFSATQMAGFSGISDLGSSTTETLVVRGSSVNLASATFFDWGTEDIISIEGTGGNDTLRGSNHADHFTGGGGNDLIVYAPGGRADTIIGFTAGAGTDDRIDLTAFKDVHTLGGVLALATQNGADTFINFGNGDTLRLQGVSETSLSADDFILQPGVFDLEGLPSPFLVNGKAAVLFHNNNGTLHGWTLNNTPARTDGVNIGPNPGLTWHVKAFADFNGDGKTDILFQNDDSTAHVWTMDGLTRTGGFNVGPLPGLGWHIKDAADFNGDGKTDILFQNEDSTVHVWTMDGLNRTGGFNVGPFPGGAWHVKDAVDLNGDGKTDILFQNNNGQLHVWTMDGLTRTNGVDVGPNPGLSWHIKAIADFTGDHKPDILWQNDNSQLHVWTMDGLTRTDGVNVGPLPGLAWHVKEAADYNGDGKTDILFQNDSGALHVWTMDGLTRTAGIDIPPNQTSDWHVIV